jgi:hypothetical protein
MYYQWTTRIPIKLFQASFSKYRRIIVKTNSSEWVGIADPVIVIFSIDSLFNEGQKGQLNVKALMSTIKQQVHGPITILLTENAHLHALSLEYNNDLQQALLQAREMAKSLHKKFAQEFEGCWVAYWHEFVSNDVDYQRFRDQIMSLYENDSVFREMLVKDALSTYTVDRADKFSDKDLYVEKTVLDLLEQCVYELISTKKGYKFDFYPGKQYATLHYVNERLLPVEKRITHVHVSISFEKK